MRHALRAATVAGIAVPAVLLGFNRGVSVGFASTEGAAGVWGLIGLTDAIALGLAVWAVRTWDGRERVALSLILGGAIGNLVDRVRDGMVTDFTALHAADYYWPTFNVADIAITAGAGLLLLNSAGSGSRQRQEAT